MTDRIQLSRRQMITASLGAVAGVVATTKVVEAALPGSIGSAAGTLRNGQLQPADRIPASTTASTTTTPTATTTTTTMPTATTSATTTTTTMPPPVPDGQIMFPIDAREDDCWISDNFGDCRGSNCSRRHDGLDILGNRDADIFAVVTGRLTKKYTDSGKTYGAGHGWTLYDETTDVTFKYFHMGTHAAGLEVGDMVQQGQVIGTVGNTGTSGANSDTNYHLHFEYRPGYVATDPRPLLVRHPNCTFYG